MFVGEKRKKVIARLTEYHGEPLLNASIVHELFQDRDFLFIRAWLKDNDLDEHMMIELMSTEVAIVTPWGVMMEIRTADDGKYGLPGGVVRKGETVAECAIREVNEELGILIKKGDLKFIEDDVHSHQYANGDKALFHCFRFVYQMEEIPDEINLNYESSGVEIVKVITDDILECQRDFVSRCIKEFC